MKRSAIQILFSAGYRVFFLAAGVFAILTMLIWEGYLAIHAVGGMVTGLPVGVPPHLWHGHEMIFGYGSAAVAGFLLTAAPNWTNTRSAPTRFFAVASALWLVGRLAMWWGGSLPPLLVAVADLSFLPVVGGSIGALLIKRFKPRQFIIVAVIAVLWLSSLLMHLEWVGVTQDTADLGLRAGLMTLAALITILGGRVTPAFTRNAMVRTGREDRHPETPMPLAAISIAAVLLATIAKIAGLPDELCGVFAVVGGVTGLARLALWRGGWTVGQPILWTLHLSYGMNALGLILLGLAWLGAGSEVAALHFLGIGGIGGMTLSVMSRAAIGHAGRALVAPRPVALAYALVPAAAVVRYAGSTLPDLYFSAVLAAGAIWIAAFVLYVAAMWPIFWTEKTRPTPNAPV
ncbi:NnrS family protein [Thalassovita sp.]|uniref:NnrS family protein n=1 Tax=Thalassovita sp. TaxID=1979401 RepID=UPI0029DE8495|nr:NnrS family protein [Thalassovita sp.]